MQTTVTQSTTAEQEMIRCLDAGMTDKNKIYTTVCEKTGIPRPTVRRVARTLRDKYKRFLAVLEAESPTPE